MYRIKKFGAFVLAIAFVASLMLSCKAQKYGCPTNFSIEAITQSVLN